MTRRQDETGSRLNIDIDCRTADEFTGGASRREMLRTLLASGIPALTAGGLSAHMASAYAQTPQRGGRIRVASTSGSAADTLDPAKGSGITDYTRAEMFYNGLTRLDAKLVTQMVLAESIDDEDALSWTIKLRKDVSEADAMRLDTDSVKTSRLRKPRTGTASGARTDSHG